MLIESYFVNTLNWNYNLKILKIGLFKVLETFQYQRKLFKYNCWYKQFSRSSFSGNWQNVKLWIPLFRYYDNENVNKQLCNKNFNPLLIYPISIYAVESLLQKLQPFVWSFLSIKTTTGSLLNTSLCLLTKTLWQIWTMAVHLATQLLSFLINVGLLHTFNKSSFKPRNLSLQVTVLFLNLFTVIPFQILSICQNLYEHILFGCLFCFFLI